MDEAGRGPLAGPVAAAAVVLPPPSPSTGRPFLPQWLDLVDDSKKLTPVQRQRALEYIEAYATAIGVGMSTPQEIDSQGIGEATRCAMKRAIDSLTCRPSYLLIDYVKLPACGIPFQALIRGDSLSYSIAAASIVAKVTRDRMMEEADALIPRLRLLPAQGLRYAPTFGSAGPSWAVTHPPALIWPIARAGRPEAGKGAAKS